ncbi:MAG: flagella synthesis protein FlgN [Betaproteobacteria bacterium]
MINPTALIKHEIELIGRFVALLREEQGALGKADASALPAILIKKSEIVEALNGAARQRNAWLTGSGYAADQAGMSAWLAANPSNKAVREAWGKLLELAREAHALHQQNGQLVAIHLQATTEALAVLNQQAQKNALYGPDGQSSGLTGYRVIDSA